MKERFNPPPPKGAGVFNDETEPNNRDRPSKAKLVQIRSAKSLLQVATTLT